MASLYVWNGSSWQLSSLNVWNGSAWIPATPYMWNGSIWNYTTPGGTPTPPYTPPLPLITIQPTSLTSGTANTVYSTALSAFGGTGQNYTFSIASGSLPLGMTISNTGILSGTPLTTGTYNFVVQAVDPLGNTGTQSYTLVIAAAPVIPGPAPPPPPTASTVVLNSHNVASVTFDTTPATAGIMYVNTGFIFGNGSTAPPNSVVEYQANSIVPSSGTVFTTEWNPNNAPASDYEIQAVYVSSSSGTTTLAAGFQQLNTWYNLGSQAFVMYAIQNDPAVLPINQITMTINIRRASDQVIVATNTVGLIATVFNLNIGGIGSGPIGGIG